MVIGILDTVGWDGSIDAGFILNKSEQWREEFGTLDTLLKDCKLKY